MTHIPQYSPYRAPIYGAAAQYPIPPDETAKLDDEKVKLIEKVIGVCLYYNRAVDSIILPAVSAIASEQSEVTKRNTEKAIQLLDYLVTHPSAKGRFHTQSIILNIHSNASYLSEPRAKSKLAGYFFSGNTPRKDENIQMNSNIFISCDSLRIVACSAAEAELDTLFLTIKEGKVL
jgi:hypothetical protein